MTEVKLVEHPLSPYAQKLKIALLEKAIPYSTLEPMGGSVEGAQILQSTNPRAEVPVLVDGDLSLFDSTIIFEYIEDRWPDTPLLPASAADRARARTLEDVMDTQFEANTWGLAEITIFKRATGEQADTLIAYGTQEIQRWFAWLDRELGTAAFFNGDTFGWGDIVVAPYVHSAGRFDIVPPQQSNLAAWLERVKERPSVAKAFAEAEGAELDPDMMVAALAAGFKREYRDHRLEWMIRAGGIDIVQAGLAADNIRFNDAFRVE